MATRHVSALLALGIAFSATDLVLTAAARAQQEPQPLAQQEEKPVPQADNAKHRFVGAINDNAAFVRSGPSNNFYSTMNLKKGDRVTVVGIKYDWLKIVPPEGSFSYIPKAFVTRHGNGDIGRVNQQWSVRAGSSLNAMKTSVQMKIDADQQVKILGEQDEYYKIVPPEGAYLYVHQQYVDPVAVEPKVELASGSEKAAEAGEPADGPAGQAPAAVEPAGVDSQPAVTDATTDDTTTKPAVADATPAPAPVVAAAAEDLGKLEAEFKQASQLPIAERPVEQLAERYNALAKSGRLSGTARKIVEARLLTLKGDAEAREEFLAFNKKKEAAAERLLALQAERQELEERRKQAEVSLYTAVGALRMSSLQQGAGGTLFRLTDPATGRTLAYIRSSDVKFTQMLNQFVGVRGTVRTDERLKAKLITPEEVEPVEAAKVQSSTIIATITPPSMIRPAAAATVEVDQGSTTGE